MTKNYRSIFYKFLSFILISCIIIQIVSIKADIESDISTEKHPVKPLRGESGNYTSQFIDYEEITQTKDNNELDSKPPTSHSNPNFVIGTQTGGGGVDCQINDNLTLIDNQNLDVKDIQTVTSPEEHENSITITDPTDFNREDGYIDFTNVTALEDWRLIENDTEKSNLVDRDGTEYPEVAQEFDVTEDYVNVTEVKLFFDMTDSAGTDGRPNGEFLIVGNTAGDEPNSTDVYLTITLETHSVIDALCQNDGDSYTATNFLSYTISPHLTLPKGDYWLFLNDTDEGGAGYFTWYTKADGSGNPDQGDWVCKNDISAGKDRTGSWLPATHDEVMMIEVLPVNSTYDAVVYTDPQQLDLNYTTTDGVTQLTSFSTVNLKDATDDIHTFSTNTSINFDIFTKMNISYDSNPLTGYTTYKTMNNSDVFWNITFSISNITTSYLIKNRTISISGIQTDWNGWEIYWDDNTTAEYDDLENNASVTLDGNPSNLYTNGSSTMAINTSNLAENVTWHVWFDAPNYIYNFNLSRGGSYLNLPYMTNVTDTVGLNIKVDETGGNSSYWIEYYSQAIHNRTDFSSDDFTDLWIINENVSQITNVNGTYDLQAFWINSAETKVGTITRKLDVFINTTIDIQTETELLVDKSVTLDDNIEILITDRLNITVLYNSTHNESSVENAEILCETNWTTNTNMNQLADDSYNASFDTSGRSAGDVGNLTIITKVGWFTNWTKTIFVHFVDTSTLTVNTSTPTIQYLEWKENTTLEIDYQNSSNSGIYPKVSFDIDGVTLNPTWDGGDEVYRFEFNSTDYGGEGTHSNINITASHSDYLDQTWTFDLIISPGITNITETSGIINNTIITYQQYAASDEDNVSINLGYYHNLTYPLDNQYLNTTTPAIANNAFATSVGTKKETNYSWTITFNPDQTGVFAIEITFTLGNYTGALFIFNLTIQEANTQLQTTFTNNTPINYSDSLIFTLFFNNTDYSENITFGGNNTIYINGSSITLLPPAGDDFRFEIASTPIPAGLYAVNITFEVQYFKSDSIVIIFEIIADTVFADHSPNLVTGITNASVISGNSLDFWIVWETEYGTAIVDSDVESNDTAVVHTGFNAGNGTHYFTFTAGSIGIIHINLTFNRSYVYDLNLTLHFGITDRGLVIANEPLTTHQEPFISLTDYLQYGDRYYFYVFINDSVDGSPLNITALDISTSANVTFVNITIAGRHLFYFDAWIIAKSISTQISIQFSKQNYASVSYQINFYVDYADSEFQSAPTSVNTYYNQNLNFSFIWQKAQNPNAPFTPFIGINNTGSSQLPALVEYKNATNGNYTFQINAIQAGTYLITLEFNSSVFQNRTHQITINIYQIPTEFEFGSSTYSNDTLIGASGSLFNYSEIHTFTVTWNESFSNSGIRDSSPQFLGNGSSYLNSTNSYSNGSHIITINASALGVYYVAIVFNTTNFAPSIYGIYFNISTMLTLSLNRTNFVVNDEILDSTSIEILVESNISLFGYGYQTYKGNNISLTENDFTIRMNGTSVNNLNITIDKTEFTINFTTFGYQWGTYNLTFSIAPNGFQSQTINVTITLLGRSITLTVSLPVTTINQGESIEISAALDYTDELLAGIGAGVTLASLAGVEIDFYIGLIYPNGTKYFSYTTQTDASGDASYLIDGRFTRSATGFANITVMAGSSYSGLPASYSMSSSELGEYKIVKFLNPLEILLPAAIILIILVTIVGSVYVVNRRRKTRVATRVRGEQKVEQSFEDIKSIRLILARHESGLQFYSESTIADLATDTDALSGMSAAISSFMEEVSGSMASRSGEVKPREIEMMSREGLHMLIWHGTHSSLIIISEVRLPDYFQERLKKLGNTLEKKYEAELLNFYSSDQIPSSVVKKMVRNFIPLHYFSAFILNEGVLTLESIKLSGKERKMLKYMKEIQFVKEGIQFFFSEQIISQLSKKWKRSEAIKFLNKSIDLNLLIEASQEDLLDLQK